MIPMNFQSLVKRNLTYWHNHIKPYPLIEEENLFQAVSYGILAPQTIMSAIDLVYVSLEVIETRKTQKKWIKLLRKLIRVTPAFFTEDQIIRIQIALGFLFILDVNPSDAERIVDDLKHISSDSPEVFGTLQLLRAKISWRKKDERQTIHHAQAASTIFETSKIQSNLWLEAQNRLGLALLISGDILKSQKIFEATAQYANTSLDISRIKNNLAITHLYRENYKQALILLSEAATIFHQSERMPQLAQTEFTRALIYLNLKHFGQAMSTCKRGLEHISNEVISGQQLWGRLLLQTIEQASVEEIPVAIIKLLLRNLASEHIFHVLGNKMR